MNNRSLFRALAIAALVIAGAATLGIGAYNAGVARGFGFFPIFPIFPFFFFFFLLFFFVVRGLFWRGPWRGGWGYRYEGVPPAFEEWHRRAHANPSTPPPHSAT